MFELNYWRKLEDDFLRFLSVKGYTQDALKHYRCVTNRLVCFANVSDSKEYTSEIGKTFLATEKRLDYLKNYGYKFQQTVIRRLDEYLDGEKYSPAYLRVNYECPTAFKDVYDEYLMVLGNSGLKDITLKQYRVFYVKLFQDFVDHGIENWDAVDAAALADAFSRSTNKHHFALHTAKLFKYLVKKGIVKYNYAGIIPKTQYWKRIPSVFSNDEIASILSSVNRSTWVGKRDYAIIILAARLGMCASDIRFLRFENVDFEKKTINFARYKTGVQQRLPLLPEVETALRDYIDNARGNLPEPYIFLICRKSVPGPLNRSTVSNVCAKYFRESGLKLGDRRHGSHALRSSLASALVAENVPYEAVRTILGHENPESITHYVKLDIENLRSCALFVPAPSGRLAKYLAIGKEVFSHE
jgi:integrase